MMRQNTCQTSSSYLRLCKMQENQNKTLTLVQDVRERQHVGQSVDVPDYTTAMNQDLKRRMTDAGLPADNMDDIKTFFDDEENATLLATHVIRLGHDEAKFPKKTIELIADRLLATDRNVGWPPYHR